MVKWKTILMDTSQEQKPTYIGLLNAPPPLTYFTMTSVGLLYKNRKVKELHISDLV
jgi:hypothetical protein